MWKMGIPLPNDALEAVLPSLAWEDLQVRVQLDKHAFQHLIHTHLSSCIKRTLEKSLHLASNQQPAEAQLELGLVSRIQSPNFAP